MPIKNLEIVYQKRVPETEDKKRAEHVEKNKDGLSQRTEVLIEKKSIAPSLVKDVSKLLHDIGTITKKPVTVKPPQVKKKISIPLINSEKIKNPLYLNYYQQISNRIKERAYANYAEFVAGRVYLTFVVKADGTLEVLKLIEERTEANEYLMDISVKSVAEASPFRSFPQDLKYPELTFNIIISFEIEE